jgi:hypothetical protein
MKKSKEISKYQVKWQLLRASIKGSKTSFEDKISKVLCYLAEEETIDAWERVYNFLEGLQRGYIAAKDLDKIGILDDELSVLKGLKSSFTKKEEIDGSIELALLKKTSFKDRYCLYKDLFNRSKKWLQGGYFHQEQESFIDILIHVFIYESEETLIKENYSYNKLESLRRKSSLVKNKHQFFF